MEFKYITNPETNRKCLVNSAQGKRIINNYYRKSQLGGNCGSCGVTSGNPIMSGGSSRQLNNYLYGGGVCGYNKSTDRCSKSAKSNPELCELNEKSGRCMKVKSKAPAKVEAVPVKKAASPKPLARAASPKPVARLMAPSRLALQLGRPLTTDEEAEFKQFDYQAGQMGVSKIESRRKFIAMIEKRRAEEAVAASVKPVPKKRGPTGPRPKRDTVQISESAKGTVRERCERQTLKKYTSRKSPPYPASACCVEKQFIHIGNDGEQYYAKQAVDGSCRWQKCKPIYPGCPSK